MQDLGEIRRIRKKVGLTQKQLAQRANVSQSLIAKIESGKIDPSYTNANKIFKTLAAIDKEEYIARQLIHKNIISVPPKATLKEAIKLMRTRTISQMPVMDTNKIVGYISETVLLDYIIEGHTHKFVEEVMHAAPPIIPPDTNQSIVANLLKHFPFVLVEDKGKLLGIITKADILRIVYG